MTVRVTVDNLLVLRGSEIRDLLLNGLVDPRFQLRSVAEHEQDLHPHEERGEKNRLDQIVEQSRCASFEDTMSNELSKPAKDVNSNSPMIGLSTVGGREIVGGGSTTEEDRRQHCSSDRFQ